MAATGAEGLVGAEGVSITKINRDGLLSLGSLCYVQTTNLWIPKVENASHYKEIRTDYNTDSELRNI